MIYLKDMGLINNFYKTLEAVLISFWGLTIIDLIPFISGIHLFDSVDKGIKTGMAFFGLVYFILKGLHNYKMNKLERDEKRILNDKLREELESMELDNEEKKR